MKPIYQLTPFEDPLDVAGESAGRLRGKVRDYYERLGQTKPMGESAPDADRPHFFLLRTFARENDLLVIFNTKRCRYQCAFCTLPAKSSRSFIMSPDVVSQFEFVVDNLRHALSIVDRVTISNEGSVLDADTFPTDALLGVASAVNELRRVRRLVLETRLEFVQADIIRRIRQITPRVTIDVLTGFETVDPRIRDDVLGKREGIPTFLAGLDMVAEVGADLTAYVLFKPDPAMTDEEAVVECERSIDFIREECARRSVSLTVRLNPMYLALGSRWSALAKSTPAYQPPRLTDVMAVAAKKANEGVKMYIGLSTEGLDAPGGTYASREDYSSRLIRPVKLFNDQRITSFEDFGIR